MCEEINVTQKAALGSETTQIAIQNNYNGLSAQDAAQMAFKMFRDYYPQLQKEALEEVERLVAEKLDSFPPENIVAPKARIAVTTLQNASIAEEHEIRSMFAALLANSMNSDMQSEVHPSFAEIVKQLSADEAKVLNYIFKKQTIPLVSIKYQNEKGEGTLIDKNFSDVGCIVGCAFPLKIASYFDNLLRLGLIEIPEDQVLVNSSHYTPLKEHSHIKFIMEIYKDISKQQQIDYPDREPRTPQLKEGLLRITSFGKDFCSACLE